MAIRETVVWESEPGAAETIVNILANPNICARTGCKVALTGRKRFCSDKCRKAQSRTKHNPDKQLWTQGVESRRR